MKGMQPINHITVTYTMKSRFSAQPIPLLLHITTYHPTKIAVNKRHLVGVKAKQWCCEEVSAAGHMALVQREAVEIRSEL